jgi:hypothetical protein
MPALTALPCRGPGQPISIFGWKVGACCAPVEALAGCVAPMQYSEQVRTDNRRTSRPYQPLRCVPCLLVALCVRDSPQAAIAAWTLVSRATGAGKAVLRLSPRCQWQWCDAGGVAGRRHRPGNLVGRSGRAAGSAGGRGGPPGPGSGCPPPASAGRSALEAICRPSAPRCCPLCLQAPLIAGLKCVERARGRAA